MIPRKFFVTSGKASSKVSRLNAFDLALKNASIAQCNLVSVSSILPSTCKLIKSWKIPPGSITYTVLARMDGRGGATIGAGVAWAWERDMKYGLVAEAHGYKDRNAIKKTLELKIREMAKVRGIEIGETNYRMETSIVPEGNFGCVIAALVYSS